VLSCREVSTILASDTPLAPLERAGLHMHLFMCKHCSRYRKQLLTIRKEYRKLFQSKAMPEKVIVKKLEKEVLAEIEKR